MLNDLYWNSDSIIVLYKQTPLQNTLRNVNEQESDCIFCTTFIKPCPDNRNEEIIKCYTYTSIK